MPIRGLTDRDACFPQIGTLRKGDKKKDEKKPGADLKHFRLDTGDQSVLDKFTARYGAEPREIDVLLPFPTVAENFEAWQEEWTAGALQHRCDGHTCVLWLKKDGTYSDEPKPCPGGCKASGRLKLVIPALERLAFVTLLTTSIHDIITLQQNLLALEMLSRNLTGIDMILKRGPRQISTPEIVNNQRTGKRVRREKWLITIEAAPKWVMAQLSAQQRAALPTGGGLLSLPAAPDEDADEIEPEPAVQIENQIYQVWIDSGRTARDWVTYRREKIANLNERQLVAKLAELQASMEKEREKIIETVEEQMVALHKEYKLDQTAITNKLASVTKGELDFNALTLAQFKEVKTAFAAWITELQPAKEAA